MYLQSCSRCFLHLAKQSESLLSQALARLAPPLLTLCATSCAELSYTVLQHVLLMLETGKQTQRQRQKTEQRRQQTAGREALGFAG